MLLTIEFSAVPAHIDIYQFGDSAVRIKQNIYTVVLKCRLEQKSVTMVLILPNGTFTYSDWNRSDILVLKKTLLFHYSAFFIAIVDFEPIFEKWYH